mgnify:CR=1 FL=1
MSQGMNDLLAGLSASLSAEEATLASLEAIICGEIHTPAHIQSQATTATFPGKWHTRATTPPVYQSTELKEM